MSESERSLLPLDISLIPDLGQDTLTRTDAAAALAFEAMMRSGAGAAGLGALSIACSVMGMWASPETEIGGFFWGAILCASVAGGVVTAWLTARSAKNLVRCVKNIVRYIRVGFAAPLANVEQRLVEDFVLWNRERDAVVAAIAAFERQPDPKFEWLQPKRPSAAEYAELLRRVLLLEADRVELERRLEELNKRAPLAQKMLDSIPA